MSDQALDFLALDFLAQDAPPVVLPDVEYEEEPQAFVQMADGRMVPANQRQRIRQCGQLRHRCDLKTGRRLGYYQRCGLWLYCDKCLEQRADKERARVVAALDGAHTTLKAVVTTEVEAIEIVRGLDSKQLRRYPQEHGQVTILHTDPAGPGVEVDPLTLDWRALARTPEGSNISGKLGKPESAPAAKKDAESKVIPYHSFVVEDPLERSQGQQTRDYDEAWELATLATAGFDPDLEVLAQCAKTRMQNYAQALRERQYKIRFYVYGFERVRADEVDWKPYNDHIRKKLSRQGVVNPKLDPALAQMLNDPPPDGVPF